jgi:hypothetical protein
MGRMGCAFLIALYLFFWTITWSGMTAYWQCRYHEDFRQDLAWSMGWSIIPIAWVVGPFSTGFYEDGFMFYRRRCEN